jgi:hypothetical protein
VNSWPPIPPWRTNVVANVAHRKSDRIWSCYPSIISTVAPALAEGGNGRLELCAGGVQGAETQSGLRFRNTHESACPELDPTQSLELGLGTKVVAPLHEGIQGARLVRRAHLVLQTSTLFLDRKANDLPAKRGNDFNVASKRFDIPDIPLDQGYPSIPPPCFLPR